jgi:hypothetical protein
MDGNDGRTATLEMPGRQAARIAGIAYLAIFALAIFANFFVRTGLEEPGDAAATVENIASSEGLFRAGLIAFLAVFAIDVVIAWALYIVFRPVSRDLSLLAAWFRLIYTVFLGVALVFFFRVLVLTGDASFLSAFEPAQRDAEVMLALEAFDATWLIGLVCFGLHLLLLGGLILRSDGVSRVLGVLLMVAGVAYIVDTTANALLPNYDDLENAFLVIVAVPSVVAELWFAIWLLRGATRSLPRPRSRHAVATETRTTVAPV